MEKVTVLIRDKMSIHANKRTNIHTDLIGIVILKSH